MKGIPSPRKRQSIFGVFKIPESNAVRFDPSTQPVRREVTPSKRKRPARTAKRQDEFRADHRMKGEKRRPQRDETKHVHKAISNRNRRERQRQAARRLTE